MTIQDFTEQLNNARKNKVKVQVPTELFEDQKLLLTSCYNAKDQALAYLKNPTNDMQQTFFAIQIIAFTLQQQSQVFTTFAALKEQANSINKMIDDENKK